jgi:excisionase family DNA binding protein
MEPEVYSIPEAAKKLKIGRNTAYAAVRTGEIPVIRIGGRLLVPKAALAKMLQEA